VGARVGRGVSRGNKLRLKEHSQRKCVESIQKPESMWYLQELSKYGRVSQCGLNAPSCSRLNAIALSKFSQIWPAKCAYMRGHMYVKHSPSVHSVNGPVHPRRWGAGVYSANEPVQSLRVGLREWTGLSAEGHPP